MEEVRPSFENNEGSATDQNITIPSEQEDEILSLKSTTGSIYKYGLTLEELFKLSLDYYKKGRYTRETRII